MVSLMSSPSEIERILAYDVTQVDPAGQLVEGPTQGSYTVVSNKDGKTALLGPGATLAQLRTYCQVVDPRAPTYPVYPFEAEALEAPSLDRDELKPPDHEPQQREHVPKGRHPGRRR